MTLHNKVKYLPEAMNSLLAQTYDKLAIVAVDDCSDDGTEEVMRQYEAQDKRVTYIRNTEWEGMISTWKKAFQHSLQLHQPEYFAWASDHDIWHPDWVKMHVATLDGHPDTVLAYPEAEAITEAGEPFEIETGHLFETEGMPAVDHLYHLCTSTFSPGYAVYGLFRTRALQRAGGFRRVVMPDRLLLYEIGAHGTIQQIHQKLWSRRFFGPPKTNEEMLAAQRRVLFGPGGVPLQSHCPFVSHVLNLLMNLSVFPADGDYSAFFKGLLMAGLLWERRKSRIRHELDGLRNILEFGVGATIDAESSRPMPGQEGFAERHLAADMARAVQGIMQTGLDSAEGRSEFLNCLVLALMANRDRAINDLQTELRGRKSSLYQLKSELSGLKRELEIKNKMVSLYERQLREYERQLREIEQRHSKKAKLSSLYKKLAKDSQKE